MKMFIIIALVVLVNFNVNNGFFILPCEEYAAEKFLLDGQLVQVQWYEETMIVTHCRNTHVDPPEFDPGSIRGVKNVQFFKMILPPFADLPETEVLYLGIVTPYGVWGNCPRLTDLRIVGPNVTLLSPDWLANCSQLRTLTLEYITLSEIRAVVGSTLAVQELNIKRVRDMHLIKTDPLFPIEREKHQSLTHLSISDVYTDDFGNSTWEELSSALVSQISLLPRLQVLAIRNMKKFDFCSLVSPSVTFKSLHFLEVKEANTLRVCFKQLRLAQKLRTLKYGRMAIMELKFSELLSAPAQNINVILDEVQVPSLQFTHGDFFALIDGSKKGKVKLSGLKVSVNCDCGQSLWLSRALREELVIAPDVTCPDRTLPVNQACEWLDCKRFDCGKTCVCCHDGLYGTVVDCRSAGLNNFPQDLLRLGNLSHILARDNNITTIPQRLPDNIHLDLSFNDVLRHWVGDAFEEFFALPNRIISLAGNFLVCSCDNRPLLKTLQEHQNQIEYYDSLTCVDDNTKIRDIDVTVLCAARDHDAAALTSVSVAFVGAAIALIIAVALYYRRQIQMFLFSRGWCHFCFQEDELDADRKYDVFISFCHADTKFVIEKLLPELEPEYSVCVHFRDFIPGTMILTQITEAIEQSRRTVIVLSRSFLQSLWGLLEFRTAHVHGLMEGRVRVVMVVLDDVLETAGVQGEVRAYVRLNTYVSWGDPWFWDKLRYALPHRPVVQKPLISGPAA